jgi:hypothetical protein
VWLPAAYNLQVGEEHTWSETPMAAHACYARDKAGLVRRLCEEHPLSGYLLRDTHPPFGGPGLAEQLPRDTEPPPPAADTERAPPMGASWRDPATGLHYAFSAGTPLRADGTVDVDRLPVGGDRGQAFADAVKEVVDSAQAALDKEAEFLNRGHW